MPPQGPPPGWQQLPGPPAPPPRPSRVSAVLIGLLVLLVVLLVVLFGGLSAYLWFDDSSTAPDASMDAVELPDELGDYSELAPDPEDEYAIDVDKTRDDFAEIVGAGFDMKAYERNDAEDADRPPPTLNVSAIRANLPLTPNYTTTTSSTKVVRDDVICTLAYYEGYDADAEGDDNADDDKTQRPQSCSRSDDGLTVYVNTYVTSMDEGPSLDELVEFTDAVYDSVK